VNSTPERRPTSVRRWPTWWTVRSLASWSIGLSAFIISKQIIVSRGGWLSFAAADPFLQRLMEAVGITRYFAMYADVDTAVAESTSAALR
jgi:hypothetical protein